MYPYTPCHPICPCPHPVTPTLVEASCGQEWYYFRSAWHVVSLWVRLTCGQVYPQPHIAPCPKERHLVAKSDTTVGQLDIWSALWSGWPLVRCTPTPLPPPLLPVEASSGHKWYYFGSALHLVNLWFRLTFGQMYPYTPQLWPPAPWITFTPWKTFYPGG